MSAPQVDAIVVNWNGRHFLPRCLEALARSTLPVRVTVVDCASTDGSVDYVRTEHPRVRLVASGRNLGYAGGANAGLAATDAPLAVILNPDVVLAADHLEILAGRFESDSSLGAAQGKLFRVSADDFLADRFEGRVLDSAGHVIRRTRMVYDRGQGELDDGRWDEEVSVFSISGAAMLLRRAMLEDVSPGGVPFDPAFFAYKEDIDLCWRGRLRGWDVRYVPDARGWHVRSVPGPGQRGRRAAAWVRRHSWINHWLMMIKNDRAGDVARHLPWVLAWELLRAGHALLRDPALLPAYIAIWRRVPGALRARREIQGRRRAAGSAIRRWFREEARAAAAPGSAG